MAELFLAQGHPSRALAIYRQLVRDRPDDEHAARRLAEIEAMQAATEGVPMSFREHLQRVVDSVPGALSATLMGFDGIAIDTYEVGGVDFDLTTVLTEYSAAAQQLRHSADRMASSGSFVDLTIASERLCCIMRPLSSEYLMAMILEPRALTGKARYLLRVTAPAVLRELV